MNIVIPGWRPTLLAAALLLTAGCREEQPAPAAAQLPLLQPTQTTVVKKSECLGPEGEQRCASVDLSADLTGIDWLDRMLLKDLALEPDQQDFAEAMDQTAMLNALQGQVEQWLGESRQELQASLDEDYWLSYEMIGGVDYLYQRGALASFRFSHYSYSGGAHGMYATTYKLMDLKGQRWLELNDILRRGKEQALYEALLQSYEENYSELAQNWLSGDEDSKRETLLSGSFAFNESGLAFSYPPYVLGPYSEGEVRLQIHAFRLKELLRPGYPFVQE